jgi:hypothetical protein
MSVQPDEHEDPWRVPDDAEQFIRSGVHEPPASARAALAARARERRAREEERQRVERAAADDLDPTPRRRGIVTAAVVGVIALIAVVFAANLSVGSGLIGSDAAAQTAAVRSAQSAAVGKRLSSTDVGGSCYALDRRLGGVLAASASTLTNVACTQSHDAQLVRRITYAGGDFPDQESWSTFTTQCGTALAGFTGIATQNWPSTWSPQVIHATEQGWNAGDRTVYCMASFSTPQTGSIQQT